MKFPPPANHHRRGVYFSQWGTRVKKTAVLLDLSFVLHKLYNLPGSRVATADEVHEYARRCVFPDDEELFRIYCYHCWPYGGTEIHPLTETSTDFSATSTYGNMNNLLRELELKDQIAFRAGELTFDGWVVKKRAVKDIARKERSLRSGDLGPDLKQKRVDMKIGLDVAWLSSKGVVEKIVLVTGDSDFVPAVKFARREGIQVVLVTMEHQQVKRNLPIRADEIRTVAYPRILVQNRL